MKTKEEILANIANDLGTADKKWTIDIEGYQIVAYWKWKDGTFISTESVTDEIRDYKFIVTLLDNGKWKELDITNDSEKEANLKQGKFSLNKSFFAGNKTQKTFEFSFGKKRDENNFGIQEISFDTNDIKQPIREYLKQCGWKKKGLF